MDKGLTMKDIYFFLNRKKKMILLVTSIVFLLTLSIGIYGAVRNNGDISESEIDEEIDYEELVAIPREELSNHEQETLDSYLKQDRYFFRVYIENEDFSIFNSSNLLTEILNSAEFIEHVYDRMSVENEELLNKFIHVDYDSTAPVFTIFFMSGEEEYNRVLAETYYEILEEEDISLLTERTLYFFDEPQLIVSEGEEATQLDIIEEPEVGTATLVILYSIGGVVFGVIFGILLAIVQATFGKRVESIYNFSIAQEDKFMNLTQSSQQKKNTDLLRHSIYYPEKIDRIILCEDENTLSEDKFDGYYSEFSDVELNKEFEEAVILVKVGYTTKAWYQRQTSLIKGNNKKIKVIVY